jgi:hypothetical protein
MEVFDKSRRRRIDLQATKLLGFVAFFVPLSRERWLWAAADRLTYLVLSCVVPPCGLDGETDQPSTK